MSSGESHRKLAAIFSADVKGYSRLMGDDEAATVRTLTTYRQILSDSIRKHRGRVVDAPGDNLLAEFASVVDAVQAAMDVQEHLGRKNAALPEHRRMDFRIGINVGDVIQEEGRLYGDGVNITARIEGLADPGGICLSASAYEQVKSKLHVEGQYLGQFAVKNIVEPVRVWALLTDATALARSRAQRQRRKNSRSTAILTASVIVAAAVSVTVWSSFLRPPTLKDGRASVEKMALPLPDKPSIAVLPFSNLSGDPEQEYFSDGLTEEIISALSGVPKLFVIARNSTFTYKGKAVKVQQVSEELGVRYVLEGSVRKNEDKVRITSQLVDAISGNHLWAHRYDRDIADIFAVQDEITKNIIVALQVTLTEGEQARAAARGTNNLEAYLKCLQGNEHYNRGNVESNALARQLAEEAIALDPAYAWAYYALARSHWWGVWNGKSRSPERSKAEAMALLQRAIALDEKLAEAYGLLGFIYAVEKQWDQALAQAERAVALHPNSAMAHFYLGKVYTFSGRNEESIRQYKIAIRLNPIPPSHYLWSLGLSYGATEQYDEAILWCERAVRQDPDNLLARVMMTAVYSWSGRDEEAQTQAAEVLRIAPDFSLERFAQNAGPKTASALRKAGLQ